MSTANNPINTASSLSLEDKIWIEELLTQKISNSKKYAAFILHKVSRTFALNIQVLPIKLHHPILLAYLFCRMADTLEDDAQLSPENKIVLLKSFRNLMEETASEQMISQFKNALPQFWKTSESWDQLLIYHCEWIFQQFAQQSSKVKSITSQCVQEMCDGMIHFTEKQLQGQQKPLIESIEELDDYCYYVAGTVGKMLCDLFANHSPLISKIKYEKLKSLCISFGLGLQLTNILKDISEDGQRNISFLPANLLQEQGLTNTNFLFPEHRQKAMAILRTLTFKAKNHLCDALEYSCSLPLFEPRLRLFCLWPLFMAIETLALTSTDPQVLETQAKIKISRADVQRIVRNTSLICWSNTLIRKSFAKPLAQVEKILHSHESLLSTSSLKGIT